MNIQKITKTHLFPKGFTLIELIVVITILAILWTIGFLSIGGYSSRARDSARIGDSAQISKSLDLSIITAGSYPAPDNAFSVTYSGGIVWYQGTIGSTVMQVFKSSISWGGLNEKPIDPLTNKEYTYSELAEGNAYQTKIDYEGDLNQTALGTSLLDTSLVNEAHAAPGNPTIAYIRGNYGGLTAKVSTGGILYVLAIPSIITNTGTTTGGSLTTNSLSGTLLFNGRSLRNASEFNPSTLVHSGAKNTVNPSGLPDTSTGILNMMNILKSTYASSDLQSNQNIAALINTSTGGLTTLGTSMINAQLGGSAVSTSVITPSILTCSMGYLLDSASNSCLLKITQPETGKVWVAIPIPNSWIGRNSTNQEIVDYCVSKGYFYPQGTNANSWSPSSQVTYASCNNPGNCYGNTSYSSDAINVGGPIYWPMAYGNVASSSNFSGCLAVIPLNDNKFRNGYTSSQCGWNYYYQGTGASINYSSWKSNGNLIWSTWDYILCTKP